jgi:hypothetical protein
MRDMNTERRQAEIGKWADKTLGEILSETPQPSSGAARVWYVVETLMAWVGCFGMGLVALWVVAAFMGFYARMAVSGWGWGWNALAWLMEFPL